MKVPAAPSLAVLSHSRGADVGVADIHREKPAETFVALQKDWWVEL